MTCIVADREGDRVIFGADSAGSNQDEIYRMREEKVFTCGPYLIGVTGSYRLGEVLRFKTRLPKPPAQSKDLKPFLVQKLIPAVVKAVRAEGVAAEGRNVLGERTGFLLGCRGEIWCVGSDLTVLQEGTFAAIGSGRLRAYAALYVLDKAGVKPARRRLELALEAAAEYTASVRGPWQFVESESV